MHSLKTFLASTIAFLRLGRFIFLTGGVVMYHLGVAAAWHAGASIDWTVYALGQAIVTSTQLMVQYSNEYFDYEADRLNDNPTPWAGGSRVLPQGQLPYRVALMAGLVLLGIAGGLTLLLILTANPPFLPAGLIVAAMLLGWGYSGPPLYLNRRGLGEITASLVVPVLTPLVGYTLQGPQLELPLLTTLVPLALLQFNMLLSVHLPDAEGDARVGKQTLVVRLGKARTGNLYVGVLVLVYGLLPGLFLVGLPGEVMLALTLPVPLAGWLAWRMANQQWTTARQQAGLAFFSIVLLMSSAGLALGAFLVAG